MQENVLRDKNELKKEMGMRLKDFRENKLKISQEAFAARLNISVLRVRKYEQGKDAIPDNVKLAIYEIWDYNLSILIAGEQALTKEQEKEKMAFEIRLKDYSIQRLKQYYDLIHQEIMNKIS